MAASVFLWATVLLLATTQSLQRRLRLPFFSCRFEKSADGPGVEWKATTSTVEKTKWGEPLAKIQADMTWRRVKGTTSAPSGVDYEEWIACAASRITYGGVVCDESQYEEVGFELLQRHGCGVRLPWSRRMRLWSLRPLRRRWL